MQTLKNNPILPPQLLEIERKSEEIGFTMPSDRKVGSLLKTLVASKPGGKIAELGTGIGLSLSWMIEGLQQGATIVSIDNDPNLIQIVQSFLPNESQVSINYEDGETWLPSQSENTFDLIFADMWPGKYTMLEETISLLKIGGIYVIDDMMEQPNWTVGHDIKAQELLDKIFSMENLCCTYLDWSTGIVIATRIA